MDFRFLVGRYCMYYAVGNEMYSLRCKECQVIVELNAELAGVV